MKLTLPCCVENLWGRATNCAVRPPFLLQRVHMQALMMVTCASAPCSSKCSWMKQLGCLPHQALPACPLMR